MYQIPYTYAQAPQGNFLLESQSDETRSREAPERW